MFATLAGGLPRPPSDVVTRVADADAGLSPDDAVLAAALGLQAELGLEPQSDGWLRTGEPLLATALGLRGVERDVGDRPRLVAGTDPAWTRPIMVDGWRATASLTDRIVKQSLGGPYSLGRLLAAAEPDGPAASDRARHRLTLALAETLNAELRSLAAAGCPIVQVDEPAAIAIGDSPAEAALFRDAQSRLLEGTSEVHAALAVTGGNADVAGAATFFDPPYASYLFDLIDGPDNWRLIARAPSDRGIVCGAVPAADQPEVEKEVVVWAAQYAAATNGRGIVRVGLSTSGSLAGLSWDVARERLELLALSASIAAEPPTRMAERLDPQALKAAPRAPRVGR